MKATKENTLSAMIKFGYNEQDCISMIERHYEKAHSNFPDKTAKQLANFIVLRLY